MHRIGVSADIEKAFLQISVNRTDRNYLRFLWFDNGDVDQLKFFRHCRVPFGVSSSPFLLGACLQYHFGGAPIHLKETAEQLKNSFYVDNCLTSMSTLEGLKTFIAKSQDLLLAARFVLRGWRYNIPTNLTAEGMHHSTEREETTVPVLGMSWTLEPDSLGCVLREAELSVDGPITKRKILSMAHKMFDPIGFTCPVILSAKLILQETWDLKCNWDETLPEPLTKKFQNWMEQLYLLRSIRIPRWVGLNQSPTESASLHVFCDASKLAYATCTFLRVESDDTISVHLIQARSRVAPVRRLTIPRLELLACCIGARLACTIRQDMQAPTLPTVYWTDSTNALAWIQNNEQWGTFVWNRVSEIRSLTNQELWRHIPGSENPADLPSRGCTVQKLIELRWWEGPDWLRQKEEQWPVYSAEVDMEIINSERKKKVVSAHVTCLPRDWYYKHFSSFTKIVRLLGWIIRFYTNALKKKAADRRSGDMSLSEIQTAENLLCKLIQQDSFQGQEDDPLRSLGPKIVSDGVYRLKTNLVLRDDTRNFRYPVILPSHHPVVLLLILERHRNLCHAGVSIVMANLRENYWILKCRKTIRKALRTCGRCRRFQAKHVEVSPAPLPEDRVREAQVFEVVGIDLAGPMFLKGAQKGWIVLYTCAVYRAVHLELVTSISTEAFLLSFRRFIARRGRPKTIYTDNGTNFVGAKNLFGRIEWTSVAAQTSLQRISWKFIPPTGSWWGGWWERLIGMVKQMLRRVLGRASLGYEELVTILCDCEAVINSRPLTYMSEDADDLTPLTPAMFLREIQQCGIPEMDIIDAREMNKRARYRQKLRERLRRRFRAEYLGQLRQEMSNKKSKSPSVGDLVLVGDDVLKRLYWPLARVTEIIPGKDGEARVARVKTASGSLLRPVQRLFPLEVQEGGTRVPLLCRAEEEKQNHHQRELRTDASQPKTDQEIRTRSGRKVVPPQRLG